MLVGEAEITKAGTTGDRYSGQAYKRWIRDLGRGELLSDINSYGGKFETLFDEAVTAAEASQAASKTAGQTLGQVRPQPGGTTPTATLGQQVSPTQVRAPRLEPTLCL